VKKFYHEEQNYGCELATFLLKIKKLALIIIITLLQAMGSVDILEYDTYVHVLSSGTVS
jgi:hypothetical protein